MENNYETLRMPELKALTRERTLRNYSQLRKTDLIAFLQNNEQRRQKPPSPSPQMSTWEPNRPPQMSTWEPEQPKLKVPLTKRQLKFRRNKDFKLAQKFLKSQMEELENHITKASKSTNARVPKDPISGVPLK